MADDLPTRMYEAWVKSPDDMSTYSSMKTVLDVARPEIEAPLRARIASLEAALKPFTAFIELEDKDDSDITSINVLVPPVTIGDLRAARAALEGKDAQQP